MDRTREKKFWLEFIKMYKERPTLWNVKSAAYKDRSLKRPAYQELLVKLRRLYPDADIDMVKRKINSMRACLRRERTKIRASRKAIAADGGKGDEYRPVWWLYEYTGFLRGEENEEDEEEKATASPSPSTRAAAAESMSLTKKEQVDMLTDEEMEKQADEEKEDNDLLKDHNSVLECDEGEMELNTIPPANYQRNEFLDILSNDQKTTTYHQTSQSQNDTEADMYGRCWAMQYRELCADQKIYAKKAIEDIFFEAKLGTLQRNSVKINGS